MLSLLLSLQVEACEAAKVFLADSFVHSCSSPDSLAVVMCRVSPPVGFGLDVSQDHVFNGGGKPWNL